MSYPRDLDEIPEDELHDELARREKKRDAGLCDYCGQAPEAPVCKVGKGRHHHPDFAEAIRQREADACRKQRYNKGIRDMADRIRRWLEKNPGGDPATDAELDKACDWVCPGFSGGMWATAERMAREELVAPATPKETP